MNRDRDIECPLFFKMQEYLRREMQQSEEQATDHARRFMRKYWLAPDEVEKPNLSGSLQ